MAVTKKTTTVSKKPTPKPTPKKRPAAVKRTATPTPPAVTPESVQSALSAVRLADEQVKYFERRLRSVKGHDTLSIRKGLVEAATEGLADARATYARLGDEYLALKAELLAGQ